MEREFDVALSFAGEQRDYVKKVAEHLIYFGIKVFYDEFYQIELWGKDLYQHFNELYKNKAIFTVIFISKNYKEKMWTSHELRSVQERALSENKEYILPVRFDDTEVTGIHKTTGYLDIRNMLPIDLANKIKEKLQQSESIDITERNISITKIEENLDEEELDERERKIIKICKEFIEKGSENKFEFGINHNKAQNITYCWIIDSNKNQTDVLEDLDYWFNSLHSKGYIVIFNENVLNYWKFELTQKSLDKYKIK